MKIPFDLPSKVNYFEQQPADRSAEFRFWLRGLPGYVARAGIPLV